MSEKLVKVLNNKDRYFNGARKGGILEVAENRVNYYLQNWFSLVTEVVEKKNIVQTEKLESKEFYQEKLDHLWVKYNKNFWAKKLSELLKSTQKKSDPSDEDLSNTEALKTQLIEEAIVPQEELEGKTNEEIIQIATDNWLI